MVVPGVTLLFEFPTLCGGEQSILAVLDAIGDLRAAAIAPRNGDLAVALARRQIPLHTADLRDGTALRAAVLAAGHPIIHANSLSASVLLGRAMETGPIGRMRTVGHSRDIMTLSGSRIAALNRLDRIIAVSGAVMESLVQAGVDADRVMVVHNGIDAINTWNPERVPEGRLRDERGIPAGALVVANVGQICLRKDQASFIAAGIRLLDAVPAAHLLLVGARFSGKAESVAFEHRLHDAIPDCHAGRVHFIGWRYDMPAVLRDIDVLLHTAREEPFGRVLLEAAALGRAIVATDVGGTREMLEDGSARLVAAGDVGAMVREVTALLSDTSERTRLGDAARTRVLEHLPIGRCRDGIAAIYHDLLASCE